MSEEIKSFRINEYLELKLEREKIGIGKKETTKTKTNIYVNGTKFDQCKFLFIQLKSGRSYQEIKSIDQAEEYLGADLENQRGREKYEIPAETEFWGHCSNLQAWVENEYDTRLLHRNLAFPLLNELAKAGDKKAKFHFKEEVALRILSEEYNVFEFLRASQYLNVLRIEELNDLAREVSNDLIKFGLLFLMLHKITCPTIFSTEEVSELTKRVREKEKKEKKGIGKWIIEEYNLERRYIDIFVKIIKEEKYQYKKIFRYISFSLGEAFILKLFSKVNEFKGEYYLKMKPLLFDYIFHYQSFRKHYKINSKVIKLIGEFLKETMETYPSYYLKNNYKFENQFFKFISIEEQFSLIKTIRNFKAKISLIKFIKRSLTKTLDTGNCVDGITDKKALIEGAFNNPTTNILPYSFEEYDIKAHRRMFEYSTGKNAIWNDKITKQYKKWLRRHFELSERRAISTWTRKKLTKLKEISKPIFIDALKRGNIDPRVILEYHQDRISKKHKSENNFPFLYELKGEEIREIRKANRLVDLFWRSIREWNIAQILYYTSVLSYNRETCCLTIQSSHFDYIIYIQDSNRFSFPDEKRLEISKLKKFILTYKKDYLRKLWRETDPTYKEFFIIDRPKINFLIRKEAISHLQKLLGMPEEFTILPDIFMRMCLSNEERLEELEDFICLNVNGFNIAIRSLDNSFFSYNFDLREKYQEFSKPINVGYFFKVIPKRYKTIPITKFLKNNPKKYTKRGDNNE
jgi:hypothetical protein